MVRSTPPNPHRFVHHLPPGSKAASLEEALVALTASYGEGVEQPAGEGLVAIGFEGEDKRIRVFRDTGSGGLIAILTQPTAVIQMFIRPCSGWAGRVTGTASATGSSLDIASLTVAARAGALLNLGRLLAGLPNLCVAPCLMVPVGPYPSGISVTVMRRFLGIPIRITVTADESAELICV